MVRTSPATRDRTQLSLFRTLTILNCIIRNSDEAAFKVVYNTYYSRLFYFIYEFIPQKDIAENIVQDTFIILWDKRKKLKDNTNLASYLFTVAKNNCLYRLRDKRYKQKLFVSASLEFNEIELNLEALNTLDTSAFAFREIEEIIKKTLEGLPQQCRKVFELSRFREMKNTEIAGELNISVKTVEGHITKSLKKFKEALKDYLPLVAYLFVI
jgi:RNA polymerase sigma-70 factor, ECF subfamily